MKHLPRGSRLRAVGVALLSSTLALASVGSAVAAPRTSDRTEGGVPLARHGIVANATPPKIYAKSWVLADATTGQVLAAKNAHLPMRPASTLKTLTAVTLLPRLDKNRVYRAKYDDAAVIGSAVGIVQGGTYTINQLFYGMMLPSGNDAAHALASAAGGMTRTVGLMRDEAAYLRADDTTIRNDSGLDAKGQYTSAYDLVLFARAGLQRADFRHYVTTTSYAFPGRMPKHHHKRATFMIYNQNPLLTSYRGAVGVKTGYTTLAGRTFVGAARRHGHLLIVALMGIIETSSTAASQLLTWGFSHLTTPPVGHLVEPGSATGKSDASSGSVSASPPLAPAGVSLTTGHGVASTVLLVVALLVVAGALTFAVRSRRRRSRRADGIPFTFRG